MRKEWVAAEKESEIREVARAWVKAGVLDHGALGDIEALYPAPWPKVPLLWGVLLFSFVSFFVVALLASFAISHALTVPAFLFAAALAFAADRLRPSSSTVGAAAGFASAFWSVVCLLVGVGQAWSWGERAWTPIVIAGAAAWAAGALRWGHPSLAVFAASFWFLLLARFSAGRPLWLIFGIALAGACICLLDRPALAPSQRRQAAAIFAVSATAAYAAVNLDSIDRRMVEKLSAVASTASAAPTAIPAAERVLAIAAMAVFPLFLLIWGIRARRELFVDVAAVLTALSIATLRLYVHVGPLWAVLGASGAVSIALALGVHRGLFRSPGRERGGWTAEPLLGDEARGQTLLAVGALALPREAGRPAPEPGEFQAGGGGFGGAGSSGSF